MPGQTERTLALSAWPTVRRAHAAREADLVDVRKRLGDDWNEAIVDLFEALAIDDADTTSVNPRVELVELPAWALWRRDDNDNSFDVTRFRSYAKACAQAQMYTARRHRQTYWVDPA